MILEIHRGISDMLNCSRYSIHLLMSTLVYSFYISETKPLSALVYVHINKHLNHC